MVKPSTTVPLTCPNKFTTTPLQTSSPTIRSPRLPLSPNLSHPAQDPQNKPAEETETSTIVPQQVPFALISPSHIPIPHKKGYSYVPHYTTSPKNISSKVCQDNILPTTH
ncbi:hypothetical protein O181_001936 [Austropuccinia psidii MF-1]|uniref:Uncharacterized protein n=1 Tax=Austropuccinia psidii MF-1 TaxID=1389203 RepID=A0A9Q3GCV7_9BASI|nr:hypothetical protein [Austropuccinia psidii MF-1]